MTFVPLLLSVIGCAKAREGSTPSPPTNVFSVFYLFIVLKTVAPGLTFAAITEAPADFLKQNLHTMQKPKQKFVVRCIPLGGNAFVQKSIENFSPEIGIEKSRENLAAFLVSFENADAVLEEFDRSVALMDYLEDYIRALLALNLPVSPGSVIRIFSDPVRKFSIHAIDFDIHLDGAFVTKFFLDEILS